MRTIIGRNSSVRYNSMEQYTKSFSNANPISWPWLKRSLHFLCPFLLGALLGSYIGHSYQDHHNEGFVVMETDVKDVKEDTRLADAAVQLADFTQELKNAVPCINISILLTLNGIVSALNPQNALSTEAILGNEKTADTCGEEYTNSSYGYPYFEKGFEVASGCKVEEKPPVNSLVTVVIVDMHGDSDVLNTVLHGVKEYDPGLHVKVATIIPPQELTSELDNIDVFSMEEDDFSRPGKIWNKLMKSVKTRYVLVARDIFYFNSFCRLQRQIFVISSTSTIGISGGAFRNESGYWKVGCYLSNTKNYLLKYTEGYRYSAMDCMFCDHLEGPFVAKTNILLQIHFDETLAGDVLFKDLFLRVKLSGILVMNCPDVMYFKSGVVDSRSSDSNYRNAWLGFARKWKVDRILYPSKISVKFTCKELHLSCDTSKWFRSMLIPPCCLPQIARALKAFDNFCLEKRIPYEIDTGTLLGAVKMNGFLPWDKDGDLMFLKEHYDIFSKHRKLFAKNEYKFANFKEKKSYFSILTPNITLEMWGVTNMTTFFMPKTMQDYPTKVKMIGVWVRAPWNPGLFARNRYGPDYLKHSQHWIALHMKRSQDRYKTGKWNSCSEKEFHGCLDRYPTDGSIGFVPEKIC